MKAKGSRAYASRSVASLRKSFGDMIHYTWVARAVKAAYEAGRRRPRTPRVRGGR